MFFYWRLPCLLFLILYLSNDSVYYPSRWSDAFTFKSLKVCSYSILLSFCYREGHSESASHCYCWTPCPFVASASMSWHILSEMFIPRFFQLSIVSIVVGCFSILTENCLMKGITYSLLS